MSDEDGRRGPTRLRRPPNKLRLQMAPDKLGAQFRALRNERGLSLAQVADATDLSASFLSLFETGKSDITFARLVRLVGFYGVSITELIPDPDPNQKAVVRKNGRRRLESSSEHAALELLTHDANRKLFPVLATLEPDGTIDAASPSPGREFFILMLSGSIEILDDVGPPIQLEKGDAAWFADDRHRRLRNRTTKQAQWVAVTTPPPL